MKLSIAHKRYTMVGVFSILMITTFQNCGQPGSIALNSDKVITDLDDNASPPPPPPPPVPGYKDFSKTVDVNAASNKVDVLVVIDNSGSMSLEQKNMGARFDSFISKLNGLDWQVGITTTDVQTDNTNSATKDGRLIKFDAFNRYLIKSTDNMADAKASFSQTVQRPSGEGSGNEQGVKATYRALERAQAANSTNTGLIRDGAALSVILVSDADETVNGNQTAGDPATFTEQNKTENLIAFINAQYPGKTFKFNSIIVRDNDLACLELAGSGNEGYGKNYQKLTNATSGVLGSVCESDYAGQLSIIGDNTSETVRSVTLDCNPVDSDKNGSVDLTVRNSANQVLTNYTLNGRIITFSQALAIGSYSFSYRCLQ